MNIPIANIYYLLCYAWDKLAERDIVNVDVSGVTSLPDLFARVLISGTNYLVKRGFDRGYLSHHEWTSRLRGKVGLQEAIRRHALISAQLPCEFDELSHNVLHNRILKTTMRRMMRTEGLAKENAEELHQLCRLLSDVQEVELSNRVFRQVQLHRNNRFYDFLLRICELIFHNLLVSEKPGASKFVDFVRDPQQMGALFEAFVRNFYAIETQFCVRREALGWQWQPMNDAARELCPKMMTDVTLLGEGRKIIIECKFTPEATQSHHEAVKLRSNHLYQINAYLDNLTGDSAATCEFILLYPTVDREIKAVFQHEGHFISIRTINLNQPWQAIGRAMLDLIARPG